jgi:hypothetical protein
VHSLGNVFVYLNFKIHQEEIVKNLCIQREMKKNECNGHCFLSKQLKKEAEKEKKEAENLKEKQELVYIPSNSEHHLTSILSINKNKILVFYPCEKPKSAQLGIFHPPLV